MIDLAVLAEELGVAVTPATAVSETTGAAIPEPSGPVRITDVTHDSREVVPGALFCCVPGQVHDGHDHAPEAVARGAIALLCEHPVAVDVPQFVVDDVRVAMSRASSLVWGDPSSHLTVIGVTGTNGKTTVVSMIESILRSAGVEARMIGTLTGERTTPESTDLQRMLAGFVDDGVQVVAMEVSSHALVQHRVDDVAFDLSVFTNLGWDHLDFHHTQEAYFAAKSKLFEPGMTLAGVVNVDDIHGRLLHDAGAVPMTPVSSSEVSDLIQGPEGSTFIWHDTAIELPMVGAHNVTNAVLAATACIRIGIDLDRVVAGLADLQQVPGRFEVIRPSGGPAGPMDDVIAVVDYAHTPDALQSVLGAARGVAGEQGRVVVVFGCGGDRDREKRPRMGEVARSLADVVVVTSDNPRTEDPMVIIRSIVEGYTRADADPDHGHPPRSEPELIVEPDRRAAIGAGLRAARAGDVVVVAGKGHETGQTIGTRTEPFDDREVVAELLAADGDR